MSASGRTAAAVRRDRLWQRHADMARIGATPRGGVNRQALTPEDARARRLLCDRAAERGFAVATDDVGNLFVRRPGSDPEARPVLTGSHLDTQPTGGRFDGAYGVLAGFEVLEALEDAGVATRRPIDVVVWTNEEGSRFQPGIMGSAVFVGDARLRDALAATDADGVRLEVALRETLAATPDLERRELGFPVAAYVEAHIEQGPRLEEEDVRIGAVTGIQGLRWFRVEIVGEEAHAGTTPRANRRDALMAALYVIRALREVMADETDTTRFTVGMLGVHPGSPNVVPGRAIFTIDLRHPDALTLQEKGVAVARVAREAAGGLEVRVGETGRSDPVRFEEAMVAAVERSAGELEISCMRLPSGAGHDAGNLARHCPTGMIFVPCERGISHNEAENATPEALADGARVLASVLVRLAQSAP
ncbi:MAG: M20 family metallo-hydrolase [Planctomycetota bacterium]|nr:M20 family metallo-hydrolase [Planctomycetota bacterium]